MNAVIKFPWLRESLLEEARMGARAHLNPHEVPRWIDETGDQDIAAELGDAISDLEDESRSALCALLVQLCERGERFPMQQVLDLLLILRTSLTRYCEHQAQRYVDKELT